MIQRNVASQPILIGPLLAVADGAAQTSGAAIAVRKDGTDVGTPGGTLSHVADGVHQYIPTQGESDCGIIGLILSKGGAASVPLNVLTTRFPVQTAGVLPAATAGGAGGVALVGSEMILAAAVRVILHATQGDYAPAKAGDAMALTSGERQTLANKVESEIIDDTDSEKVLEAITNKIAAANPDLSGLTLGAIAAAVRTNLATELARIDAAITSRSSHSAAAVVSALNADATQQAQQTNAATAATQATTAATQATTAATQATAAATSASSADSKATTILNRIGAWTGSGINTLLGAFRALWNKASGMTPTDLTSGVSGANAGDNTTDSLPAIRDRGDAEWVTGEGGGGGDTGGARLVTVTVLDQDDAPVVGAKLRFRRADGGVIGVELTTDEAGVATDQLDDGSWILTSSLRLPPHTSSPQAVTVAGDTDVSHVMTRVALPEAPSDHQTTGYLYVLDGHGNPLEATVAFHVLRSDGTAARGFDGEPITATSDPETGLLTIVFAMNTRYRAEWAYGTKDFTTGDDPTFPIPEIVGSQSTS